jgi:hypothetical protein
MTLELNALAPWFAVAVSLAALAYSVLTNRKKDSDASIAAIHQKYDDAVTALDDKIDGKAGAIEFGALISKTGMIDDRLIRVETEMKHLPDRNTVHTLEAAVAKLSADVGVLSERVKPIASMADRIQEALLERVVG